MKASDRLSVLVLYDDRALRTNFVKEHLDSLRLHSRHVIHYASGVLDRRADFTLEMFDAVIIHFTVRLAYEWHLAPAFATELSRFRGGKILLIQDECDSPRTACSWIRKLGVQVVFSTVPAEYREIFYPSTLIGDVRFERHLTSYVSVNLESLERVPPMAQRRIMIGYRGRELPYWYGRLAREKMEIGVRMKTLCMQRDVPCDIEWTEDKRLDGAAWYQFLASCRATLGTESGCNVVDRDGSLRTRIEQALAENPKLTFEEAFEDYVSPYEDEVQMNQMAPKIFEAIAHRTALVLFEGEYSGIVRPHEHYIPLQKDFGNVDEVIQYVHDARYLESLADRAYQDVIASGAYRYATYVARVDNALESVASCDGEREWVYGVVACRKGERTWTLVTPHHPLSQAVPYRDPDPEPRQRLLSGRARVIWDSLPGAVRVPVARLLGPSAEFLLRRLPRAFRAARP